VAESFRAKEGYLMSQIVAKDLTVQYPGSDRYVIRELGLSIKPGQFVIMAGPSGSGKSTFCRTLIGLIPNLTKGEITAGSLSVCNLDTQQHRVYELTQHVGMVFQDPEMNIFSLFVLDELAFGPENMGLDRNEIIHRIEMASNWVHVQDLWPRRTDELSGGQKQRVAIAGALSVLPAILVLDEPTTDLDPIGKKQVINTLKDLRQQLGITVIVVEHDLSNLIEVADRLIVLGCEGKIVLDGAPRVVLDKGYQSIQQLGLRVPACVCVWHAIRDRGLKAGDMPLCKEDARDLIASNAEYAVEICDDLSALPPRRSPTHETKAIQVAGLDFQYRKNVPLLQDINLSVPHGEFVALVGPNGSGKSTLLRVMVGLLKARKGTVGVWNRDGERVPPKYITDHVSFVFQDPNHQLFEDTVWDEVAFSLKVQGKPDDFITERVTEVLDKVNLLHSRDRHPATLSRGEKRRLAVATALSHPIDVLLLDEPTTGQDLRTLGGLFEILGRLNRTDGTTIIFVTHDMWTVWRYATRVVGLKNGSIIFDGPTVDVLRPENEHALNQLELELPVEAMLGCAALDRLQLSRSV
jgi:energy-coupling factor transport system ATP-binding protein